MDHTEIFDLTRLIQYKDWKFIVAYHSGSIYLQVELDGWRGRKWLLSKHMTKSEIIQTAFKAVLTAEEHECREAFTYRGTAIFGPHFDVDALVSLIDHDYRPPPTKPAKVAGFLSISQQQRSQQ